MTLKRYNLPGYAPGYWVKYDDHLDEIEKSTERAEAAEKALQAITALPSVDGLTETERTQQELRLIEQARQIARAALEAKP